MTRTATGIYPVILCGGSGKRVWPLSRRDRPKQFAVWKDGKSLFETTFERVQNLPSVIKVICVGSDAFPLRLNSHRIRPPAVELKIGVCSPRPKSTDQ